MATPASEIDTGYSLKSPRAFWMVDALRCCWFDLLARDVRFWRNGEGRVRKVCRHLDCVCREAVCWKRRANDARHTEETDILLVLQSGACWSCVWELASELQSPNLNSMFNSVSEASVTSPFDDQHQHWTIAMRHLLSSFQLPSDVSYHGETLSSSSCAEDTHYRCGRLRSVND